ncbi:cold-responsive protein kinase 1-like [Humulus lupulus]|uniref:cold-responsive protein kinase 1-like n=1 Tax=Humulus lupulus TaxID=3486 RepID=UPI002B400972|nr:cold-responsive protein kinase 1-like [Humulus lupulus]
MFGLHAKILGMDVKPLTFNYAELKMATNDFSSANKLGERGFGLVYRVCHFSNENSIAQLKNCYVMFHTALSSWNKFLGLMRIIARIHMLGALNGVKMDLANVASPLLIAKQINSQQRLVHKG